MKIECEYTFHDQFFKPATHKCFVIDILQNESNAALVLVNSENGDILTTQSIDRVKITDKYYIKEIDNETLRPDGPRL